MKLGDLKFEDFIIGLKVCSLEGPLYKLDMYTSDHTSYTIFISKKRRLRWTSYKQVYDAGPLTVQCLLNELFPEVQGAVG